VGTGAVVDLLAGSGRGPLWGVAGDDLNATLLAWGAGDGPAEQLNTERDVLYVVVAGSGTIEIDGAAHDVRAPAAVLVEKGRRRRIVGGPEGIRYLTAHLRRGGLQIRSAPQR
jgi:mannose-6-phosphate isomerase-like protein (cupin superfamily)